MTERRVGLWLIGACGGVGTTATLGLAALGRGLIDSTSLVTALPMFEPLGLDAPAQFVVGGHEVRRSGFRRTVRELQERYRLSVLMAEQNFNQAVRIADRGYVIVHGRIAFEGGSAEELNNNELVRKFYLGL